MNILGIETSCDETAAAVVQDGRRVHSSVISTQFKFHEPFSGVVPEVASRAHAIAVNAVVEEALKLAQRKIDAIAVTVGPGLVGALLVGRMSAETLGWAWGLPVYGVNHIEGHLLSSLLAEKSVRPPFLGLVVSGGHTELIYAAKEGGYELVGHTRDDAAGEAFDKVAKMMGLGYPGGPIIDRLAREGDPEKFSFPRPWLPGTWDFSFSGLKTAMLYRLRERKKWGLAQKKDLCAGFQQAVIEVIVGKTVAAAHALGVKRIVVGGGVAANSLLRTQLAFHAKRQGLLVTIAPLDLCTDNAAMIAACAYMKLRGQGPKSLKSLKIQPRLQIPSFKRPLPSFRPPRTNPGN